MLLTYFLCGFVVEPAIHSHNLRAKKRRVKTMCVDYQVFMSSVPRVDGVENGERMWNYSPKSWGITQI